MSSGTISGSQPPGHAFVPFDPGMNVVRFTGATKFEITNVSIVNSPETGFYIGPADDISITNRSLAERFAELKTGLSAALAKHGLSENHGITAPL